MHTWIWMAVAMATLAVAPGQASAGDPACAELCASEGACELRTDGYCVPGSDADCAAAEACAAFGRCAIGSGGDRCAVTSATMCGPETTACNEYGRCALRDTGDACQTTDASCAASSRCTSHGLCHANEWRGGCEARSTTECAKSPGCAEFGTCDWSDGTQTCVATEAGCVDSGWCAKTGNCIVENGACAPADAAHCTASSLCETDNFCTFWPASEMPGFDHALCGPSSAADCAASAGCRDEGRCRYVPPSDSAVFPIAQCVLEEGASSVARQPPLFVYAEPVVDLGDAEFGLGAPGGDGGSIAGLALGGTPHFDLVVEVDGDCAADELKARAQGPVDACLLIASPLRLPTTTGKVHIRTRKGERQVAGAKAKDWDGVRDCVFDALSALEVDAACKVRLELTARD